MMNLRAEIDSLLAQARQWEARDTTDFAPLIALREKLAPIVQSTRYQPHLHLDACEALRRTERATGLAVRRAQQTGALRSKGVNRFGATTPAPHEALGLSQSTGMTPFYVAAETSQDVFEQALQLCRQRGVMGQRPMMDTIRTLQGTIPASTEELTDYRARRIERLAASNHTSRQIADELGVRADVVAEIASKYRIDISADAVTGKRHRRLNPAKVIRETVLSLEGLVSGLSLVDSCDYDDFDHAEAAEWAASLATSISAFTTLKKELNRVSDH